MWKVSAPSARARAGQRSDLAGVISYPHTVAPLFIRSLRSLPPSPAHPSHIANPGFDGNGCENLGCAQTFRLDRVVWID